MMLMSMYSCMSMESRDAYDTKTEKKALFRMKQVASIGSITCGFGFFTATAARHMHWPYWSKRAPLFGFVSFNAFGQMTNLYGNQIEQFFKRPRNT